MKYQSMNYWLKWHVSLSFIRQYLLNCTFYAWIMATGTLWNETSMYNHYKTKIDLARSNTSRIKNLYIYLLLYVAMEGPDYRLSVLKCLRGVMITVFCSVSSLSSRLIYTFAPLIQRLKTDPIEVLLCMTNSKISSELILRYECMISILWIYLSRDDSKR